MRPPGKVLLFLPVLLFLYFYGLTATGMLGPDEPRYAAIGREMAISGDWITPRLWGEPWFEKPALLYWMTALGNVAGLGPELAPRLPVALLSFWFLIFYYLRMRREFGERPAWISAGILATSGGWLAYSHVAVTEIPLAVFFASAMLLALPWVRSGGRRGLAIGGALLGFAILAKGLVPVVLAVPLFWVGRRRWKDLALFAGMAVLVAAPWYVLCYERNGWPFFETFILRHHLGRFVTTELQHVQPWWFYIPVLAGLLFPWTPMLLALRRVEWRDSRHQLLLGWFLFGFLFFSASTNKLPGYILPLLPAAAALIGIQMAAREDRWLLPASAGLLVVIPVAIAVLPQAVATGLRRASWDSVQYGAMIPIALVGILVWRLERKRSFGAAFITTWAMAALAFGALIATTFPRLDAVASARPDWNLLKNQAEAQCVDEVHRNQRYGLNYYAGRELPRCSAQLQQNHDNLDGHKGKSR